MNVRHCMVLVAIIKKGIPKRAMKTTSLQRLLAAALVGA